MYVSAFRERMEAYRPGGWWRRDLLLAILEETYPQWLTGLQVAEICRAIRPDWNWERRRELHACKSLGRLYGLRLVDRIGVPGGFAGRVRGGNTGSGWRRHPGFRYRIIRREESLL